MYRRAQAERWPNLARTTCDYLATPVTSTPAERYFSQAKYALPPERNSLASSSIRRVRLSNPFPIQLAVSGSLPSTKTGRFDCGVGDKKASQRVGCVLTLSIHFSTCIGNIIWNLIIPMEFVTHCEGQSVRVWRISIDGESVVVRMLWGFYIQSL